MAKSKANWMYQEPIQRRHQASPNPLKSQIPGFGHDEQQSAYHPSSNFSYIKPTDTPYVILSKQGGYADLLRTTDHSAPMEVPSKRMVKSHPRCDWFYLEDNQKINSNTNGDKKEMWPYHQPDYMSDGFKYDVPKSSFIKPPNGMNDLSKHYEESRSYARQRGSMNDLSKFDDPRATSFTRKQSGGQYPYATDKDDAIENLIKTRSPSQCPYAINYTNENTNSNNFVDYRPPGYGVRLQKLRKNSIPMKYDPIEIPQSFVPKPEIENMAAKNFAPFPSDETVGPVSMSKLMSHGYISDWQEKCKRWETLNSYTNVVPAETFINNQTSVNNHTIVSSAENTYNPTRTASRMRSASSSGPRNVSGRLHLDPLR